MDNAAPGKVPARFVISSTGASSRSGPFMRWRLVDTIFLTETITTGTSGSSRAMLRQLVESIPNLVYDGNLIRGVIDVLICTDCPQPSHKVLKAMEWGIPVVSVRWLYACAANAAPVPVHPFLLHGSEASLASRLCNSVRLSNVLESYQLAPDERSSCTGPVRRLGEGKRTPGANLIIDSSYRTQWCLNMAAKRLRQPGHGLSSPLAASPSPKLRPAEPLWTDPPEVLRSYIDPPVEHNFVSAHCLVSTEAPDRSQGTGFCYR